MRRCVARRCDTTSSRMTKKHVAPLTSPDVRSAWLEEKEEEEDIGARMAWRRSSAWWECIWLLCILKSHGGHWFWARLHGTTRSIGHRCVVSLSHMDIFSLYQKSYCALVFFLLHLLCHFAKVRCQPLTHGYILRCCARQARKMEQHQELILLVCDS